MLGACVCVCVCACGWASVFKCVCVRVCVCLQMYACVFLWKKYWRSMRTHTNMRVSVCVFLSLFVFVSVFGCIRMCIYVYFLVRVHVRVRVCVCTTVKFPQEMPGCRNRPHSEGMEAKQSRVKKRLFGSQPKNNPAWAGWSKRLGLVQATPWADFAATTTQLWSTTSAIIPCVPLSWKNYSLLWIIVNSYQLQKRHTIRNWVQLLWEFGHFDHQHRFFVPNNCTTLVFFHLLRSSLKTCDVVTLILVHSRRTRCVCVRQVVSCIPYM